MKYINVIGVSLIVASQLAGCVTQSKLDQTFGLAIKSSKQAQMTPSPYVNEKGLVTFKELSSSYTSYTQGTSVQSAGTQSIRGNLNAPMSNQGSSGNY